MNDPQRIREMAMGRYAIGYSAGSLPFEGVTVAGWTAIAPPTPKSKTELVARAALLPLTLQGRAIGNAERSKRAASLLLDQGRELTTNGWGHLKHLPDISKYSAYEDLRERSERTPGHVGVMTQDGFGFYLTPKQVTDLERRGTQVVAVPGEHNEFNVDPQKVLSAIHPESQPKSHDDSSSIAA